MSDLYLIAHKVRGEPAFDVAEPIKFGDENGWIIPTSGHRAYPYWSERITDLSLLRDSEYIAMPDLTVLDMPPDLSDHYHCNDKVVSPKVTEINLEELDL